MRLPEALAFWYQSTMLADWAIGPVSRWVSSTNTTKSPVVSSPEKNSGGPENTHSPPRTNVASSAAPVTSSIPGR
jgi:hypothetical protein